MITLILPGYSVHNKEWLEQTAQNINIQGEIRPIYWEHWVNSDKKFNPEEKSRLIDNVTGTRMVNIVAKSIGTLVASYIIRKSPEKIYKVILNGICLNDLDGDKKEIIKTALKLVPSENIICFQNEGDPHGDFDQANKFLSDVCPEIKVISKNRDDHEYPYKNEFRKFLLG